MSEGELDDDDGEMGRGREGNDATIVDEGLVEDADTLVDHVD